MANNRHKEPSLVATEHFLLASLSAQASQAPSSGWWQNIQLDDIDWNILFSLADWHGVLPLLYWSLKDVDTEGIPESFVARLSEYFNVSTLRNRILFDEFNKIIELLISHNIDVIALKGIALASTIYENIALRQFVDLDFLVHESNIDLARNLLEQRGYHHTYSQGTLVGEDKNLSSFQEEIYRNFYHEYEMNSQDGLIYIDLHWLLSPRVYPVTVSNEMAWSYAVAKNLYKGDAKVLCDELNLIYTCIHAAKDGWTKVKWVVDIDRLIKRNPDLDWDQVFSFADYCHCKKMLVVGLFLSQDLVKTSLPKVALDYVRAHNFALQAARYLSKRILRSPEQRYRVPCIGINHVFLRLCDTATDRLRYLFRLLTYPQARDCNFLGLNERMLPLWRWFRPFRILAHCLRRSLTRIFAVKK